MKRRGKKHDKRRAASRHQRHLAMYGVRSEVQAILRAAMKTSKKPDCSRVAADIAIKLKQLGWEIRHTVRVWCSSVNRILARITALWKQGPKKLTINKVVIAHTHA